MSKDSKMIFEKGEKVLCYHGPLIYEAKCLEAEMQDSQAKYYIHYAGWNKNWDEWVPENRVLKYNDANIQKQKDLQKTLKSNPQSRKVVKPRRTDGKDADALPTQLSVLPDVAVMCAVPEASRKKRGRADNPDMAEVGKAEVATFLPDGLKAWLAQEHIYIHEGKLAVLPARSSALHVATQFFKAKAAGQEDPFAEQVVGEVLDGVMEHFAVALPAELLYAPEKAQFKELSEKYPNMALCELYGGAHLLRMLAKFGSKLSSPRFDEFTTELLLQYLNELLRFIADNHASFLRPEDYRAS
ncbi:mortality factor 4-like protein 1 isoform X2 [Bacillus rossius redtenbacheri]|uniref:mortality factor 4-like protein 1 isoform X2 n=1 Tax=Bacillus rossius redtenbacheri TaxID=93214 RepID=UPI002FDD04A7